MPRQKSEITGVNLLVAARVTRSMREEFVRLGGAAWLRKMLADSLERRFNEKSPNK
jgi:hypothetical protein